MPPKKKAAQPVRRSPLPPPNTGHPCADLLATALAASNCADRPHSPAYHAFLTSPYYPSKTNASDEPPKKRARGAATAPKLPPPLDNAIEALEVQRKLLAWFDGIKEKRGMPWRKDVDPEKLSRAERNQRGYEVWVSEIMLQQTTVAAVIPYWTNWMTKFPDIGSLARADEEEVQALWKGLGYYSRAKRLLDGAKKVMEQHDGTLPRTAEGLLDIDGIGPYSAGSISSIAFGARSPLIDGNVTRVLSRLVALHAPAAAKSTTSFLWALADVLVPPQPAPDEPNPLDDVGGLNKPGAWNQALMELGATVCTPKNPKCDECPLSGECLAYAEVRFIAKRPPSGPREQAAPVDIEDLCTLCAPLPYETSADGRAHSVEVYPMAKEKTKKREEDTAVCVVEWVPLGTPESEDERQVLLVKRPEKGLLAGLFEFPAVDLPPEDTRTTLSARTSRLNKLLKALIDLSNFEGLSVTDSERRNADQPHVLERQELPAVVQVYSHITRTYLSERVVLTSQTLPALCRAASTEQPSGSAAVVQSRVGAAKWVPAGEVAEANVGGAVGKIWEERVNLVRGTGVPGGKKSGAAKKGKTAARVEKGQASLTGFFAKKQGGTPGAASSSSPQADPGKSKSERVDMSDDPDDVVVIMEASERTGLPARAGKEDDRPTKAVVAKTYKKRRIASDSEDD